MHKDMQDLLEKVKSIALQAGDVIVGIYNSDDFDVKIKTEGFESPLTKADSQANNLIVSELKKISDLPIISEEGNHEIGDSTEYWLVDPLDGTKEFVKKTGEFTVNIGLVKNGVPVMGVVYAPMIKTTYYGGQDIGAFKEEAGNRQEIKAQFNGDTPVVVASRSHGAEEVEEFLKKLGDHEKTSMGSSLKLCLVAEGKAALYPRLGPTSLWDTAAADAVVRAAGGSVKDMDGSELVYDPKTILNPYFIVRAQNFSLI